MSDKRTALYENMKLKFDYWTQAAQHFAQQNDMDSCTKALTHADRLIKKIRNFEAKGKFKTTNENKNTSSAG